MPALEEKPHIVRAIREQYWCELGENILVGKDDLGEKFR
jgi:hypothetical protein